MFSVTFFQRTFTFSWRMFLFTLCAVILCMRLGYWQLARAHEKKEMQSLAKLEAKRPALNWHASDKMPVAYQSLAIEGHYLPTILLLDNQHYDHQFGYDVVSPMVLSDKSVVLIDRGWIKADINRQILPNINIPSETQTLRGYAYYPSNKNWLLGPAMEMKTTNMHVMEVIDTKLIGKILHKSVYPFIIRLAPDAPDGYVRQWPIVSMPPSRHIGYAMQWYALALVVVGFFIGFSMKKSS